MQPHPHVGFAAGAAVCQKSSSTARRLTLCGKVERFQQTLKKWLTAQHRPRPQRSALLVEFTDTYNSHRPHRALGRRSTCAVQGASAPRKAPPLTRYSELPILVARRNPPMSHSYHEVVASRRAQLSPDAVAQGEVFADAYKIALQVLDLREKHGLTASPAGSALWHEPSRHQPNRERLDQSDDPHPAADRRRSRSRSASPRSQHRSLRRSQTP